MTLPSEYAFAEPKELVNDLKEMYLLLRESIEGFTQEFEGKVYGSAVEGVGTYSDNNCYYVRRGDTVDLFYNIVWTGHTGSGDLRVEFPFYEKQFIEPVSISSVRTYDLAWPAGSTYVVFKGTPNENYGTLDGCRDAGTAQVVQLGNSGSFTTHHRYIGQVQK